MLGQRAKEVEHQHLGVALLLLALVSKISLALNDWSKLRNPDYFRTMSRGHRKIQTSRTVSRGRRKIQTSHPRMGQNGEIDDAFCTMSRGCRKIQLENYRDLIGSKIQ